LRYALLALIVGGSVAAVVSVVSVNRPPKAKPQSTISYTLHLREFVGDHILGADHLVTRNGSRRANRRIEFDRASGAVRVSRREIHDDRADILISETARMKSVTFRETQPKKMPPLFDVSSVNACASDGKTVIGSETIHGLKTYKITTAEDARRHTTWTVWEAPELDCEVVQQQITHADGRIEERMELISYTPTADEKLFYYPPEYPNVAPSQLTIAELPGLPVADLQNLRDEFVLADQRWAKGK